MVDIGRKLLVIGDRILVRPETKGDILSPGGLILQSSEAVYGTSVKSGIVTDRGNGQPIYRGDIDPTHWKGKDGPRQVDYIPIEVEIGDFILFMESVSIKVRIYNQEYFVMPQAAVILIVRDNVTVGEEKKA